MMQHPRLVRATSKPWPTSHCLGLAEAGGATAAHQAPQTGGHHCMSPPVEGTMVWYDSS